ncbi:MAG: DUF2184 domain-containing protein [Clostridia bacterium]|nr:DUF2184 domain-containing protein [Clostridia bacterium]
MSKVRFSIPADKVKAYAMDAATTETTLDALGIHYEQQAMDEFRAYATDAAPSLQTAPNKMTPIQFLQHWIPEMVKIVTASRDADEILGRDFAGDWADEEIVQTVIEYTGKPRVYGDKTTFNLASFNVNYETRTIVRFEQDVEVGKLEEARASKQRIDAQGTKRDAAATALAINANDIAFNGYNAGNNKTYGLLNDPSLPAYTAFAQGSAGYTTWATKTFNEIVSDIKAMMSALRVRSGNNFKPEKDESVLALSVAVVDHLQTVNMLGGTSVLDWLHKTYPGCRVTSAVQLDGANASANVAYLFAEKIDGKKVIAQYMQDALRLIGVEQHAKNFLESYSNATAGVMLRIPVGLVRFTGC